MHGSRSVPGEEIMSLRVKEELTTLLCMYHNNKDIPHRELLRQRYYEQLRTLPVFDRRYFGYLARHYIGTRGKENEN